MYLDKHTQTLNYYFTSTYNFAFIRAHFSTSSKLREQLLASSTTHCQCGRHNKSDFTIYRVSFSQKHNPCKTRRETHSVQWLFRAPFSDPLGSAPSYFCIAYSRPLLLRLFLFTSHFETLRARMRLLQQFKHGIALKAVESVAKVSAVRYVLTSQANQYLPAGRIVQPSAHQYHHQPVPLILQLLAPTCPTSRESLYRIQQVASFKKTLSLFYSYILYLLKISKIITKLIVIGID